MKIALLAALLCATSAQARELTLSEATRIEKVNQLVNEAWFRLKLEPSDPMCAFAAVNKAGALLDQGFQPGEIAIAIVTDEHGSRHAVAEVFVTIKGKPHTDVLDNRFAWTEDRQGLERFGYVWLAEFKL